MNAPILMMGFAMMSCGSILLLILFVTFFGRFMFPTDAPVLSKRPGSGGIPKGSKPTASTPSPTSPPSMYEVPVGIKTDCPSGKRGVVGWENVWRDGKSYMWCNSDSGGKGSGIHVIGNDKLSYLSIPSGMKATIYENVNMGGLTKTFDAGEWDLHAYTFDNGKKLADRASSLKIEGTAPNADTIGTTQFSNMNR